MPSPETPRCKRPPLAGGVPAGVQETEWNHSIGAALGNVNTGGRVDCSLYKQFILVLFSIFRRIFIYFSFFTEFYFLFTIQSLFFFTEFYFFFFFYDTEFIFLDTEFVLFFICSDLIDFIFIFITFHLSCTAVSGSWIKDLFIYFIYFDDTQERPDVLIWYKMLPGSLDRLALK